MTKVLTYRQIIANSHELGLLAPLYRRRCGGTTPPLHCRCGLRAARALASRAISDRPDMKQAHGPVLGPLTSLWAGTNTAWWSVVSSLA